MGSDTVESGKRYEVAIIGGGPAGLTAAIYTGRALVSAIVLERGIPGGQAATSYMIENYPGFPKGISGPELARKMEEHAREFGVQIQMGEVSSISPYQGGYLLKTTNGAIEARSIVAAPGCREKSLGVPGEKEFRGKGVSYCATCDGAFFKEKEVVVVGGGDSAVEEAMYLTRFASRVHIVHRRDQLRAAKGLGERAKSDPRIEMVWGSVVLNLEGKDILEGVRVANVKTHEERVIPASGIFIYIGLQPNTECLRGVTELDDQGYIIANEDLKTSARGVFAAGDARRKSLRQVSTAVGDGALAAVQATKYIQDN